MRYQGTARLRAITLIRPWPWAMLHLPASVRKRIENRYSSPPRDLVIRHAVIGLHAGLKYDPVGAERIAAIAGQKPPPEDVHPKGAIVGAAWIDRVVRAGAADGAVQDEWFFGPVGIVLRDAVALPEPVRCTGTQGWWWVPDADADRVWGQLRGMDWPGLYAEERVSAPPAPAPAPPRARRRRRDAVQGGGQTSLWDTP